MPSLRPAVPLAAIATLAGAVLLTGCGGGKDDNGPKSSGATSTAAGAEPAGSPKSTAAAAAYHDPMDIAKKIRGAHLGCTKATRTESLGSGKVICGGTANISIEFYETPSAFLEVKKTICQMGVAATIVADPGRRWMVTSLNTGVNKRIQRAVGGKVVKTC
ncbi:hypothetical protein GCM10009527_029810 [Actinomadura nitritigenes]|uniref:Lipoprotein n=1 Tax=Actinomadura nitritigenes TaxID=134602 RepID=A0ABS3QV62_9ACTN|nr:hypothetical protein [Actinomadura nitritigenes]MBO2437751.1 hypothetical protein [Actinomadura nitritigenes]